MVVLLMGVPSLAFANEQGSVSPATPPGTVPETEGTAVVLETSGRIRRALYAAGGSYLLLHIPEDGLVEVLDVEKRELIARLPVRGDALVASTYDRMVIAIPVLRILESWSWSDFSKRKTAEVPFPGVVKSLAAGHAAAGPVVLHGVDRRSYLGFLDPTTLEPQRLRRATYSTSHTTRDLDLTRWGAFFDTMHYDRDLEIRAAAAGRVFAYHVPRQMSLFTLSLDQNAARVAEIQEQVAYVVPTVDGAAVGTSQGLFSADLKNAGPQGSFLPTADPRFLLSLHLREERKDGKRSLSPKVTLMSSESFSKVQDLPELTEMQGTLDADERRLPIDHRYFLIPKAQLLVTIPPSDDRVVMRRMTLATATEKPIADERDHSPTEMDEETEEPAFRTWTDSSRRFSVVARFDSLDGPTVILRRSDGVKLRVPLDKLSEPDQQFVREMLDKRSSEPRP
jgi:hypothetical protein